MISTSLASRRLDLVIHQLVDFMLNPTPQHTVLFTVDDLERMITAGIFAERTGRIELIEGVFRKMSPASELHDNLIRILNMWSVRQQTEEEFEVAVQMGIRMTETESMPEPDLFWVKTGNITRPTTAVVPLIIEVSVTTITYDRDIKSRLYALDDLEEYWIVDGDAQRIEVRRQPRDGEFTSIQTFDRHDSISPLCLPSATLDIEWLFHAAGC